MSTSPALHYEELKPPAPLSPWIAALWQLRGARRTPDSRLHRILPDGCVDFLFDVAADSAAGAFVGPMSRAVLAPLTGDVDVFGIRFRPGVARSVSRFEAGELRDLVLPLASIGATPGFSTSQLFAQTSLPARARLVMPWVARRLAVMPAPDVSVRFAIEQWNSAVAAERALPSVAAVARRVGVSERCLERRFTAWVGYAPAHFRRLVRFRAALAASQAGKRPWAETAMKCGYADQSHLSRDFREFASTTAIAWAGEQRPVGNVQDGAVSAG